jgi:cell division protein FtsI (penicillin-binding protein 3)
LAAALEEKLTRPEEVVDCQMGAIEIAGHRIHDHKSFGELTVAQVLANSSDVGAIKIALRLGEERFDHYIRAFGFGRQTGIELPGETRGITKPASRWSKTSIAAISMGQEIGVSPLQLVSMLSTIANDGVYHPPRVVAGETAASPNAVTPVAFHPADSRRVISSLTAAEMKKMLEGVVLFGTGKRALLEGYSVAGKTGTAQKVDPTTGTYSRSQYIASFAGFAPVNNPAVTVAVILDSPAGPHEGGQVAAPVFARITQQVLAYLNVAHDIPLTDKRRLLLRASAAIGAADVSDSSADRLGETVETAEMAGEPSAAGNVLSPKPAPIIAKPSLMAVAVSAKSVIPRERSNSSSATVMVEIEGGLTAPSLLGMPVREALEVAEESGFELDVVGSGVAREQEPPPSARISPGGHIVVQFAR